MDNLRAQLRAKTRTQHERLHHHFSFERLLAHAISKPNYVILLKQLLGYHLALEAALDCCQGYGPAQDFPFAHKSPRIIEDLKAFEPYVTGAGGRINTPNPPNVHSYYDWLGVMYVREGAMLGGRLLAQKLDHLCGLAPQGRTFFQGTRRDLENWHVLCEALDRVSSQVARQDAISSAKATFELFENWMDLMEPISLSSV
jgi:heme oxygenase (biliverdin-IX-beta and delta-forming)